MKRFFAIGRMPQLAAALSLAAVAALPAHADETEIVLGLPTAIGVASTGQVLAAMDLGYFEEEGLNVTLQEFQGGAALLPQIANKAVTIGEGGADPLVIADQPGRDPLPVKLFYNAYPKYHWQFVVPADSPVHSLSDLKGQTIGVGSLANSHMPISRQILADAGLKEGADYDFMAISVGAPAFRALTTGQVGVYNTWAANVATYEATSGERLRQLDLPPRYAALSGAGYYAHEDTIRNQPGMLAGFGRAVAKGTIACTSNPRWCVEMVWRRYPNLEPREGTHEERVSAAMHIVEGQKAVMLETAEGPVTRYGAYPDSYLPDLIDLLHQSGMIEGTDRDPQRYYTNELVEPINAFDPDAIRQQAGALSSGG